MIFTVIFIPGVVRSTRKQIYTLLSRFYVTGSFLLTVGDIVGVSESSMSIIVAEVSTAIAELKSEFIFLPKDEKIRETRQKFYQIGPFPTVIGAIDYTHSKVIGQGGEISEIFRNRKQFHSINVQSIASQDLLFQDIVARWPGSTHDSYIFNESRMKERFASGEFSTVFDE
jgi:nuclease HARBI1